MERDESQPDQEQRGAWPPVFAREEVAAVTPGQP